MIVKLADFNSQVNEVMKIQNAKDYPKDLAAPKKRDPTLCAGCDEPLGENWYFCVLHKLNFCRKCARNDDKKEVEYQKVRNCWKVLALVPRKGGDCILEPRSV